MKQTLAQFVLFLCVVFPCTAQETDMITFMNQWKYPEAITAAKNVIEKDPASALAYNTVGTAYFKIARYDSSRYYFQKAIAADNDSSVVSCWSHWGLAKAYIYAGRKDLGIAELKRTYQLNLANDARPFAMHVLDSLGAPMKEREYPNGYIPKWVAIESKHLTFKFDDTTGVGNAAFKLISIYEREYERLDKIFDTKTPSKITVHVWTDDNAAKTVLKQKVDFSYARQCFMHVYLRHKTAYQLAHIMSYWSGGAENTGYDRFISWGISGCFANLDEDKYAYARYYMAKHNIADVLEVWRRQKKYDDEAIRVMGGSYVRYMYEHSNPAQFRELIKKQTLQDMPAIYGSQFEKMAEDFNLFMGVK